jgi:hypothetical protein
MAEAIMGFYAKRINEFSVGQWMVGKGQALIQMVILLKLFDAPPWVYIAATPIIAFLVWVFGFALITTGLWARINRETFKGSLYFEFLDKSYPLNEEGK